jgi:uncharacterized protein
MNFTPVSVSDYSVMRPFFSKNPYSLSIYSPSSIIAWSYQTFKAYYAINEGQLLVAGQVEDHNGNRHLILPLAQEVIYTPSMLYQLARKYGFERYWYVPGDYLETLDHKELDVYFIIEEQREFDDYVYLTEDLMNLKGNKFSKKRNLINQFSREYILKDRVKVDDILPADVEECLQFLEIWCEQHNCDTDQESNLACEKNALITTLKNMAILESRGIKIRVDGRVSAFGIGSRLNENTATLNFEKADSGIKGLYQFLDNECAKWLFSRYRYINKESDMNIPNIADSKQSYNPIMRIKSYSMTLRT